jgi:hypothetical protein
LKAAANLPFTQRRQFGNFILQAEPTIGCNPLLFLSMKKNNAHEKNNGCVREPLFLLTIPGARMKNNNGITMEEQ